MWRLGFGESPQQETWQFHKAQNSSALSSEFPSAPWVTNIWRITLRSDWGQLKGRRDTAPERNHVLYADCWPLISKLNCYLWGVAVSSLGASTTIGVLSTAPWKPGERGSYKNISWAIWKSSETCTIVFRGVSLSPPLFSTAIGVRETSSVADLKCHMWFASCCYLVDFIHSRKGHLGSPLRILVRSLSFSLIFPVFSFSFTSLSFPASSTSPISCHIFCRLAPMSATVEHGIGMFY